MDVRGMFANREAPHFQVNQHPALSAALMVALPTALLVVLDHDMYVGCGSDAGDGEKAAMAVC